MSLEKLIETSRRYGSDTGMVLLGGGNTSFKDGNIMYVKASGHKLGSIGPQGFVRMDLEKLAQIWAKVYSPDDEQREDQVLKDLMACRLPGEDARPSVEALLHAIIPFAYVVHLHPALVNGITCSQKGKETIKRMFPQALWVPLVKPGYILAETVRNAMNRKKEKGENPVHIIFLQNHGIFVGADTLQEIDQMYKDVFDSIEKEVKRKPDFTSVDMDAERMQEVTRSLSEVCSEPVVAAMNKEFARILSDESSFASVSSAYTPDHIVYSGFKPLWVSHERGSDSLGSSVKTAFSLYAKENGKDPKIVCVQNLGVFALGNNALALFFDTVSVSVYSESFGGPQFMDTAMIDFIRTWEVEKYRSSLATK
ncbi:class II aldolase/adducin family protein [uncultured Sphaerochaeta sp.]|uniref:class II aldolase/adducin family protein n=1 Tax=uncultured Sphaerochaeta sp. TaxID=886478 RepID=UPI002A0A286E|nr:class II aldolase/adducin family protein [uncultured Sphaerochaeta sp.]